jgi:DNA-formamidopyrimidine glycosylase
MPERVEVQIMIENLNKLFKGRILKSITICTGRYVKHGKPHDFLKFKRKLPLKIKQFNVKGKFIWINFINSDWIITITLGLTGHFKYNEDGKYCRYQFTTDNGKFTMDDMRNFGTLSFSDNKEKLDKKLKSIGIDIFTTEFKLKQFKTIIKKQKAGKLIGIFLLEQKYISGIGNYLRSDILYNASISPFRIVSFLSDNDIKKLFYSIIKIVGKSYKIQKKNGLHSYPFLVYKQKKTKKLENVSHDMIGKRFIYWVPNRQI